MISDMDSSISIRPFDPADEDAVVQLWHDCGLYRPVNDPHLDIAAKLKVNPELFLVAVVDDAIAGTVMAGYDGHRGWINYFGVHPTRQRLGIGRRLMNEAEIRLRALGCPKINLQVRSTNSSAIDFYKELGFAVDDVVSMGKRLTEI